MTKEHAAKELADAINTVQECVGVQQPHELEAIIHEFLTTHDIEAN